SIHPFARVVAVADAYAAMTHKRPHREPMIPYQAMREILTATGAGRFDAQVVRALLDRVSAFPVGSGVELNDGRVCRVLRARIGAHTRPIVAPVDAAGRAMGQAIDLFTQPQLSVRRAVSLPADTAVC
ncbi:MAG: phosphohydrolase, partial [Planctomycetota bacterium]